MKMLLNKIMNNKMCRNFLIIFSGEGICSVFGFFSTIFIIQTVGSSTHGVLVGTQTYANMFYALFSFKTFEALIKYMARAEAKKDFELSKLYIKWSVVLDIICLSFMLCLGILLKKWIIQIMGWDEKISGYCTAYLFIFLLNFQGTTVGVLRYFERYNLVVKANIIACLMRMIGYFICFALKREFICFFAVECISTCLNFLLMDIFTLKTLKDKKLLDFYKVKLKSCPAFLKFSLYNNLSSTIDLPINQITTLIINKYLGFAATSAYSVMGSLCSVINKLGSPISQIIYPEMNQRISKMDIAGAKRLSYRLKMLMMVIFVAVTIFVLITHKLWLKLFITDPDIYVIPLVLYIGYVCYCNSSMGTHNLFMALGYVKYNIPILFFVNLGYLGLLFFAIKNYGLSGVIVTFIIQAFVMVVIKELIMRKKKYKEFV